MLQKSATIVKASDTSFSITLVSAEVTQILLRESNVVRGGRRGGDLRAHAPRGARGLRLQDPAANHVRRVQVRRMAPVRQDLVRQAPRRLLQGPMRDPPRGLELRRSVRGVFRGSRQERELRRAVARFV